nr:N-acetylmuramoyl-L-alanine amidase [Paenibacillus shirakamiensis]
MAASIALSCFTPWSSEVQAKPQDIERLAKHAFPDSVVLIDVGHGGIDGGTSFEKILEKDINLDVSRKLYMILRSQGFKAVLNRSEDYALSDDNRWLKSRSRHMRDLAQRKGLSQEITTAVVVSLHVNWGRNSIKRGALVLHQDEGRSVLLAHAIQDHLDHYYDINSSPVLGKPFYLLKHTEVPAVIVEMGFLSNPLDRSIMVRTKGQTELAEAIASGITAYFTEI